MNYGRVFLGGTYAGPDYRNEFIPLLKCDYFNPVVTDWDEKAQDRENKAKEDCGVSLYVLTPYMEGVFSIAEIVEDAITRRVNRTVVCIIKEYKGIKFSDKVSKSMNALKSMLAKHNCKVFDNLTDTAAEVNRISLEPFDCYLCFNRWLSLKKLTGVTGDYVYSHEERCKGHIVAVLPYIPDAANADTVIIARKEFTPPWGDGLHLSSITGGVDENELDNPILAASRELFEETGMKVPVGDFISLDVIHGTKSTDTIYHLFAVDVTSALKDFKETSGEEGDENEKRAHNCQIKAESANNDIEDPILYALIHRFNHLNDRPIEEGFDNLNVKDLDYKDFKF